MNVPAGITTSSGHSAQSRKTSLGLRPSCASTPDAIGHRTSNDTTACLTPRETVTVLDIRLLLHTSGHE